MTKYGVKLNTGKVKMCFFTESWRQVDATHEKKISTKFLKIKKIGKQ